VLVITLFAAGEPAWRSGGQSQFLSSKQCPAAAAVLQSPFPVSDRQSWWQLRQPSDKHTSPSITLTLLLPLPSAAAIAAISTYQTLHAKQLLLSFLPALPILPIEPFQLTSFALSLLLVFRTNSSYGRWNEGRRRFGRITTTCRDICRQVSWCCKVPL
jgi:hypothetical protein